MMIPIVLPWFLVLPAAQAFGPHLVVSFSGRDLYSPTTPLYGLRSFLRRKLSNVRPQDPSALSPFIPTTTTTTIADFSVEMEMHPRSNSMNNNNNNNNNSNNKASTPSSSPRSEVVATTGNDSKVGRRATHSSRLFPSGISSQDLNPISESPDLAVRLEASPSDQVVTLERTSNSSTEPFRRGDRPDDIYPYTLPIRSFIDDDDDDEQQRTRTKFEKEFQDMLATFARCTPRDVLSIRDPRLRCIFQGVMASYGLPEVLRAFEVLFEDYAPLRVAGRLVYGKLLAVMRDAHVERRNQIRSVVEATGLSEEVVEASQSAYFQMVVHKDDTATELSLSQIVDYGLAEMAVEMLGYESFDDFVRCLNPCEQQKVDFQKLMIALQSCPSETATTTITTTTGTTTVSMPECNPATVLQEIASRLDARETARRHGSDDEDNGQGPSKKDRLNQRFNSMVEQFQQWKTLLPPPQDDRRGSNDDDNADHGRRMEILRGCFVGAESPEIVEALRVVYMDYSALRMSGDLIFKVMTALVGRWKGKV